MSGWEEKLDPVSGRPYYVNRQTRESRWEPPAGFGAVDGGADGSIDGDAEADDGDDFFTSLNVEERLAVQGQQRNERIDAMQESAAHEEEARNQHYRPAISDASRRIAEQASGADLDFLQRNAARERERQRKLDELQAQAAKAETDTLRSVPRINAHSRELSTQSDGVSSGHGITKRLSFISRQAQYAAASQEARTNAKAAAWAEESRDMPAPLAEGQGQGQGEGGSRGAPAGLMEWAGEVEARKQLAREESERRIDAELRSAPVISKRSQQLAKQRMDELVGGTGAEDISARLHADAAERRQRMVEEETARATEEANTSRVPAINASSRQLQRDGDSGTRMHEQATEMQRRHAAASARAARAPTSDPSTGEQLFKPRVNATSRKLASKRPSRVAAQQAAGGTGAPAATASAARLAGKAAEYEKKRQAKAAALAEEESSLHRVTFTNSKSERLLRAKRPGETSQDRLTRPGQRMHDRPRGSGASRRSSAPHGEGPEYTFKPQISEASKRLMRERQSGGAQGDGGGVVARSEAWRRRREERLRQAQEDKVEEEMRATQKAPQISERSRQIALRMQAGYTDSPSTVAATSPPAAASGNEWGYEELGDGRAAQGDEATWGARAGETELQYVDGVWVQLSSPGPGASDSGGLAAGAPDSRQALAPGERFEDGATVVISGLNSRADLNGTQGVVTSYAADSRRYLVVCDADSQTRAIKPENLAAAPTLTPAKQSESGRVLSTAERGRAWQKQKAERLQRKKAEVERERNQGHTFHPKTNHSSARSGRDVGSRAGGGGRGDVYERLTGWKREKEQKHDTQREAVAGRRWGQGEDRGLVTSPSSSYAASSSSARGERAQGRSGVSRLGTAAASAAAARASVPAHDAAPQHQQGQEQEHGQGQEQAHGQEQEQGHGYHGMDAEDSYRDDSATGSAEEDATKRMWQMLRKMGLDDEAIESHLAGRQLDDDMNGGSSSATQAQQAPQQPQAQEAHVVASNPYAPENYMFSHETPGTSTSAPPPGAPPSSAPPPHDLPPGPPPSSAPPPHDLPPGPPPSSAPPPHDLPPGPPPTAPPPHDLPPGPPPTAPPPHDLPPGPPPSAVAPPHDLPPGPPPGKGTKKSGFFSRLTGR